VSELLVKVELVRHQDQRYATAGDWQIEKDGSISIQVSDTGTWLDAMLVGLHEFVEALICHVKGIRQHEVDAFDIEFNRSHDLSEEEPGEDPAAPYRREHAAADVVERIVALEAGVIWREYADRIDALFAKERA
jgi:hypothetical protein